MSPIAAACIATRRSLNQGLASRSTPGNYCASCAQNAAGASQAFGSNAQSSGLEGKFRYYVNETYLNPGVFTAPAFRAGIRRANPPGKGATQYPPEWRQGGEAFGRNYGDAFAQRVTFETAR